ncbi:MAG: methyltransferase domain-containing protein [Myxococcota bacterium]
MDGIDWKAFAEIFDDFNSEQYNPILPLFCHWAVDRLDGRDSEPGRFLDVGCGTGLVVEAFVDWYPEASFLLVDSQPEMLASAHGRLGRDPRIRIEASRAEPFLATLEPASLDVVLFARSFYALADHDRVASDAVRALRPDGLVLLLDFTGPIDLDPLDEMFGRIEPDRWPLCRRVYEDFNHGLVTGRYRTFTAEEMADLWRAAGGKLRDYQSNRPASGTHFAAIGRAPDGPGDSAAPRHRSLDCRP